jgi:hypothetical protein
LHLVVAYVLFFRVDCAVFDGIAQWLTITVFFSVLTPSRLFLQLAGYCIFTLSHLVLFVLVTICRRKCKPSSAIVSHIRAPRFPTPTWRSFAVLARDGVRLMVSVSVPSGSHSDASTDAAQAVAVAKATAEAKGGASSPDNKCPFAVDTAKPIILLAAPLVYSFIQCS